MDECSAQPFQASDEAQPGLGRGKGIEKTMRYRIMGVGVALLAVLAFSAMAVVSSAMAAEVVCGKTPNTGLFMKKASSKVCEEELAVGASEFEFVEFLLAEWLEGPTGISETMLVETSGELLLENEKAPIVGKAAVICSGILVGNIGPDGADDITEVLNLSNEAVSSVPLTAPSLTCVDETDCEANKVWAVGLPWLSLLELWETKTPAESGFVDLITSQKEGSAIGWYVECTVLGVKASEECTTAVAASSETNVAPNVQGAFSVAFTELMALKLALCTGNKEETGIVVGSGTTVTSLGATLTVSE
jgi:hypothetical protein